ncbi:hypothetical protein NLI96_g7488 [Meripilus lineatus]|uniref:Uncharacterized protein n=1 Tax=Meripilus lineatus TaxID=2056292 RepID=A0AAD5UZ23_9APHY|nr:hypothetical protein NLI96_g7488 [Physisporinus lineatus]
MATDSEPHTQQPPSPTSHMSQSDPVSPPPPYRHTDTSSSRFSDTNGIHPPPYPTSYTIGTTRLDAPLVDVGQLKAHLALLRAFKALKVKVDERSTEELPAVVNELDKEKRWAWFVGLAVERFQRWLESEPLEPDLRKWVIECIPPIDVLMVWHSYTLNPSWYAEDCQRLKVLRPLRDLRDKLLAAIVDIGDIGSHQPTEERKRKWTEQTGTSFDPFDAIPHLTNRTVQCPTCEKRVSTPFVNKQGSGYAQFVFNIQCECGQSITKEVLGAAKFAQDMARDHKNPNTLETHGSGVYLAGTLYSPTGFDDVAAGRIKDTLRTHDAFRSASPDEQTAQDEIMKATGGSMSFIKTVALSKMKVSGERRVARIMGAYTDDRPFSIDLVGAVVRQGSFIGKMYDFGWTEPGYFDTPEDEVVLLHAIARYHAFLDLMKASPASFFVPTLDIDLVWHTHQMMGYVYGFHCKTYILRYIDQYVEFLGAFNLSSHVWLLATIKSKKATFRPALISLAAPGSNALELHTRIVVVPFLEIPSVNVSTASLDAFPVLDQWNHFNHQIVRTHYKRPTLATTIVSKATLHFPKPPVNSVLRK